MDEPEQCLSASSMVDESDASVSKVAPSALAAVSAPCAEDLPDEVCKLFNDITTDACTPHPSALVLTCADTVDDMANHDVAEVEEQPADAKIGLRSEITCHREGSFIVEAPATRPTSPVSPSPVSVDIPSESLLQVPVRTTAAMPSRFPSVPTRPPPWSPTGAGRTFDSIFVEPALIHRLNFGFRNMRRPRSHGAFVGASRGSPVGSAPIIQQQRASPRRMQPMRPTSLAPIPPQGDGACGWSQHSEASSSNSRAGSAEPSDSRDSGRQNGSIHSNGGTAWATADVGSHEEVATEQPLAQLPVRAWLRTASVRGNRVAGRRLMNTEDRLGTFRAALDGHHSHHPAGVVEPGAAWGAAAAAGAVSAMELSSSWQVADELGHTGGMAAPRYLLVRLGECIPAETGAAPVHLSRLDTGPQWRDFLNYGEGRDPQLALDELLSCPCCLTIFRQPIALPCGHSLCRSCYARVSAQPAPSRRCPLCRADLPQCDLRVNLALAAVCDSLRAFRAASMPRSTHLFFE